ncbi:MAG TPA: hypothetical protein ENJ42_05620, partial [Hellea balneolensis]|nr:hypothetical protein [Hellea balneolensis]
MPSDTRRNRSFLPKFLVTLYDSVLGAACMYGVMRLRYIYEGKLAPEHIDIKASLVFGLSCIVIWVLTRANRAVWRFISFEDVRRLLIAVVLSSLLTPVILFLFFGRAEHFPRSAPFLNGVFFFSMLILSRALVLFYHNGDIRNLFRPEESDKPRAILIGRSQTLHNVLRDEVGKKNGYGYHVQGLIETEGSHQGRSIRGVPVIGNLGDVRGVVANMERIHGSKPTLIFVEGKANQKKATQLVKLASEIGASLVRMRPGHNNSLTPFEAADLIGRQAKSLDMTPVRHFLKDKKVMITGAGGTIGSELAAQVAGFSPAHMILVDASEMNLYAINQVFKERGDIIFSTYLGDVRNARH